MSALGMCKHNNIMGYCPACLKEKQMRHLQRMGIQPSGMGTMGETQCPSGYYNLKVFGVDTGQCVPSAGTLSADLTGAATQSLAAGAAQSSANIQAAKTASGNKLGNWIVSNPILAAAVGLGLAAVIFSFIPKRA